MNMPNRLDQKTRKVWAILCLAVKKFLHIDGGQWAGAFAFNAFLSLFPFMILLVTIASSFVDRHRAGQAVIAYVENYVPIRGEMQTCYGMFGGIIALLLWIYISGCIVIFGACLCAGQAEMRTLPVITTAVRAEERNEA